MIFLNVFLKEESPIEILQNKTKQNKAILFKFMNDCIIKQVEKDDNCVRSDVTNKKASELLNRIEENNAVNAEEQT
jgi:hypothetical protein